MAEGSREAIRADDQVVSVAEVRELQKQVRELQRVLGKKTMENEILRDALQIAHEKTDLAIAVLATGKIRRESGRRYSRRRSVSSNNGAADRRFSAAGAPRINHKQIFRIMKLHGLLLQRKTGRRIERAHNGAVRTLRSNMRWCSDGFEISCWNGEIVRVAFTLDTCDREAITWTAPTAGVTGEMVRDVMLVAVERRFGNYRAPHRAEYLADNGSCYTASETIDCALAISLMPCFTPIRSHESIGMAESFVKTFKRDYVRCSPRPNALTVLISSTLGLGTTTARIRIDLSRCSHLVSSSKPTYN